MSQILSTITVIGIDIGKNSFHVIGLDEPGAQRSNQKPGYIDARPLATVSSNPLASRRSLPVFTDK